MNAGISDYTSSSPMSETELKALSRNARQVALTSTASDSQIKLALSTFEDVLATASTASLTATHRVAAWNALCATIDAYASVGEDRIRRLIWTESVWSRAFRLYLGKAHVARPKSVRQLLATLSTTLKASELYNDRSTQSEIAHLLLHPLVRQDEAAKAKTSVLALVHFLSKGVLDVEQLLECYTTLSLHHRNSTGPSALESLLRALFEWALSEDFGSTVAQLVVALIERNSRALPDTMGHQPDVISPPIWSNPLQQACATHGSHIARLHATVLPVLFKRSFADYVQFLEALGIRDLVDGPRSRNSSRTTPSDSSIELLYAALQAGKDIGMIHEADRSTVDIANDILFLPLPSICRLISQQSRSARLTGLTLLINSQSSTRPMLPSALSIILKFLPAWLEDTDADFRGEFFGLMQRLTDRLRAILASLAKQLHRGKDAAWIAESSVADTTLSTLSYHQDYLTRLCYMVIWTLRPTAGYQAHISGLRLLEILARSGLDSQVAADELAKSATGETKWPLHMCVLTSDAQRMLLDLVMDPFEDVRQTAASILTLYPTSDAEYTGNVDATLHVAQREMLATRRADKADGVAHLYKLTCECTARENMVLESMIGQLEAMLTTAMESLSQAVSEKPVHGLLAGIRMIAQHATPSVLSAENRLRRLIQILESVWMVVKATLCNDAPEGYMPEDADDGEEMSNKDTLSYCWRALKESSLLLGAVVQKLLTGDSDEMQRLMELSFTQLVELRHRGAFSTVAQTWVLCCCRSTTIHDSSKGESLEFWYDRVINIIGNATIINTRRSAGLPSLLCGILVADESKSLIKRAMLDLDSLSRRPVEPHLVQNGSLPQVHAMNCVKDVLKHSRLGEASAQYVPAALSLAADALGSQAWALRNCGLMLFRAIIDRLLGTGDAYLDDDLAVDKRLELDEYPQLLPLVLRLLAGSVVVENGTPGAMERHEQVFPALQLLQRLVIPENQRPEVLKLVRRLTACPVWHVRDKAARVYATLAPVEGALERFEELLQAIQSSQNDLHGALLAAKYLMQIVLKHNHRRRARSDGGTAQRWLVLSQALNIVKSADTVLLDSSCPAIKAAYIDLYCGCNATLEHVDQFETDKQMAVAMNLKSESRHYPIIGFEMLMEELATHMLDDGMSATLRLSLARALAMIILHERQATPNTFQRLQSTIIGLASVDRDACALFLEGLADRVRGSFRPEETVLDLSCCLARDICRNTGLDITLRCKAQQLAVAISGPILALGNQHAAFAEIATEIFHGSRILDSRTNQQYADMHLQLQAAGLEYFASTHALVSNNPAMKRFQETCVQVLEGSGLHSREAVALAMSRLQNLWGILKANVSLSDTFRELSLIVYDLLQDDDEDLRVTASRISARVVSAHRNSTFGDCDVPLVAGQKLLAFMCKRWASDGVFAEIAIVRAFALPANNSQSIASELDIAMQGSTALFVEEKQNLYLDEAREVKAWTQVAMRLRSSIFPRPLIKRLCAWIMDGLEELTRQGAVMDPGPLGWSTKPEVFVLGLRILSGVELLLHMVQEGVRIHARPSDLRRKLAQLTVMALEGRFNPLWAREMYRISAIAVGQRLSSCVRLLRAVLPRNDVGDSS